MCPPFKVKLRPIALAVSLAFVDASAWAAILTVTDGGDPGDNTTCTLRQAITSANKNAHGASSCIDGSGSDTIVFAEDLVGSTITLASEELVVKGPTTIIGSGQIIDANYLSRVMYVGFTTFSASHLTLIHGNADGNSGGGMFVLSGNVNLTDVNVVANTADYAAGIATFNYSELTLNASTVSGNTAARKGGGIEIINGSQVLLNQSTVSGNNANRGAGVFASYYSELQVNRSSISGNTAASGTPQSGGGIYGYHCGNMSRLSVVDSAIVGNVSNNRGAGIVAIGCPLRLTNTTIAGNTSTTGGGAIYLNQAPSTIVNSTIAGNNGYDTGGLLVEQSTLTLANTILTANLVDPGNEAGADLAQHNSTVGAQYSLLGNALQAAPFNDAGSHNVFTDDPGLGPLQDNGGLTLTMAPLDVSSPAIDAGSNELAQDGLGHYLTFDQRVGFLRVANGTVDIGAFEYQPDRIFSGIFEALP